MNPRQRMRFSNRKAVLHHLGLGYDEKVKTPSEKFQEDLEPLPG